MDRRAFLKGVGVAGAVTLVGTGSAWASSNVTVYRNGPIVSMGRYGRLTAIAIAGGHIVGVNGRAHELAHRGARVVDLDGRAMYPGFIDCHSHWFGDWAQSGIGNPAWADVASPAASVRNAVSSGWTTITEHFASEGRLIDMEAHDRSEALPVRVNAYLPRNWMDEDFGPWYTGLAPGHQISPRLRVAGVKFFADGGLTPYLREPYDRCRTDVPHAGYRGDFFWDPEELTRVMGEVHAAGYQITVHCSGDGATDILLDAMERFNDRQNARRHNLTHLILLHDDQIRRLRAQRLVANVQLSWFHANERERLECWLGDRVRGIGRWRDLIRSGVRMCGSTDFPWGVPVIGSVLRTLFTASTRIGPAGEVPADWMASQTITVRQAIALLTRRAAWAVGELAEKGTLRPGKLADITVFDDDPLAVEPDRLMDLSVAMTMVGGRPEYLAPGHGDLAP